MIHQLLEQWGRQGLDCDVRQLHTCTDWFCAAAPAAAAAGAAAAAAGWVII
jgi:hypothetical protein